MGIENKSVAIIGASGAIGGAMVERLAARDDIEKIYALSRSATDFDSPKIQTLSIDLADEDSICKAAQSIEEELDQIVVATGLLHEAEIMPEKALRDLSADAFHQLFAINTIGPALVAKHFLPKLPRDRRAVFAAISARVSSLGDNRLGGWYAYRASKTALNMVLKNASIEMGRKYDQAIIIGLHPGTVDSNLSKPFQKMVADGKLFTPAFSAEKLLAVMDAVSPVDTGKLFAWDGQEIEW